MISRFRVRFIKFLISGGLAAAIEYTSFAILTILLGPVWLVLSQTVSFIAGFAVSFSLNRNWVFKSKGSLSGEITKYIVLAAVNLLLSNLLIIFLIDTLELHEMIAKFIVMAIVVAWNYVIFKKIIFKHK